MPPTTLIFSIALRGFERRWKDCLESQARYATAHSDYRYGLVKDVGGKITPREATWLKIPLIIKALEKGYAWVVWLDADCEVKPRTPRVQEIEVPGKSLYLAKGHSGRVNSGVMIIKNTSEALDFFREVLKNATKQVPREDRVTYENGHIIHYSKGKPFLEIVDSRWNNNRHSEMEDYIRHYTGPLDPERAKKRVLKSIQKGILGKIYRKVIGKSTMKQAATQDWVDDLGRITNYVCQQNSVFTF